LADGYYKALKAEVEQLTILLNQLTITKIEEIDFLSELMLQAQNEKKNRKKWKRKN